MNAPESLFLKQARRHVDDFAKESKLMRDHQEALDCMDCDAFLQMGIEAFGWLIQSDRAYRKALYDDQTEYNEEFEKALVALFRAWLGPCEIAENWIIQVSGRGYALENLANFRKCAAEVRGIVRFYGSEQEELPAALRELRDRALDEHRDGQTAEFV